MHAGISSDAMEFKTREALAAQIGLAVGLQPEKGIETAVLSALNK